MDIFFIVLISILPRDAWYTKYHILYTKMSKSLFLIYNINLGLNVVVLKTKLLHIERYLYKSFQFQSLLPDIDHLLLYVIMNLAD